MRFRPIVSRLPTLLAENPTFRRFWLALLVSSTGDRFGSIAMNLYAVPLYRASGRGLDRPAESAAGATRR
jgi:hypothetical protein